MRFCYENKSEENERICMYFTYRRHVIKTITTFSVLFSFSFSFSSPSPSSSSSSCDKVPCALYIIVKAVRIWEVLSDSSQSSRSGQCAHVYLIVNEICHGGWRGREGNTLHAGDVSGDGWVWNNWIYRSVKRVAYQFHTLQSSRLQTYMHISSCQSIRHQPKDQCDHKLKS